MNQENIAEIAEHLTLDEAKDLLAMNYKKYDSDLHVVSSTVPIAVGPTFAPEELQEKSNISSLKTSPGNAARNPLIIMMIPFSF